MLTAEPIWCLVILSRSISYSVSSCNCDFTPNPDWNGQWSCCIWPFVPPFIVDWVYPIFLSDFKLLWFNCFKIFCSFAGTSGRYFDVVDLLLGCKGVNFCLTHLSCFYSLWFREFHIFFWCHLKPEGHIVPNVRVNILELRSYSSIWLSWSFILIIPVCLSFWLLGPFPPRCYASYPSCLHIRCKFCILMCVYCKSWVLICSNAHLGTAHFLPVRVADHRQFPLNSLIQLARSRHVA